MRKSAPAACSLKNKREMATFMATKVVPRKGVISLRFVTLELQQCGRF
jgi:hypothetical protein